jgi:hypothetical protein
MASVWHASGICPDGLRVGGALTLGGESDFASSPLSRSQKRETTSYLHPLFLLCGKPDTLIWTSVDRFPSLTFRAV